MFKIFITIFCCVVFAPCQVAFAGQDFTEIKNQAQFSNDTYLKATDIESALHQQGQKLIHQAVIPVSEVSYFLSQADDVQTIAIRGTANLENAMLNLDISLQLDSRLDIALHRGFASGANAVYNDVKPFLTKDKPIHITGHSLGGAIAVVLAMHLRQDGYQVAQIITFGQPKVTNVTGASKFANLPLIRVVTPNDIVPLVPPLSPLQIKNLDIYWHMGEEVILRGKQEYAQTNGVKSMLRATKFTTSIPSDKNLLAHQMATYMNLIDELQDSPIEVPYKTNIGLFGFSLD